MASQNTLWCVVVSYAVIVSGESRVVVPTSSTTPEPRDCLVPGNFDGFYQCAYNHGRIVVIIELDYSIKVQCEGKITCGQFPEIEEADKSAVSQLTVQWCELLPLQCVLNATGAPPAAVRTLSLTASTLELPSLPGLEELSFVDYGGENNEDWLSVKLTEQLRGLRELSVSGGRTKLRTRQFTNMKNLRRLDLMATLNELPQYAFEGLNNFTDLLVLAHNNISHLEANQFVGLNSLKALELSWNHIVALPAGVFVPLRRLKQLYLRGNRLKEIEAGAFKDLTSLEELYLSGNKELSRLAPDVFSSLGALKRLEVANCALRELAPAVLLPLRALRYLDLTGNQLIELPPRFLRAKSDLDKVLLSNNKLRLVADSAFIGATNLRHLMLDHNELNLYESATVSPFSNLLNLQQLDLSYNSINYLYDDWRIWLLKLRELNLSHNNFTGWLKASGSSFSGANIVVDLRYNKIEGVTPRQSVEPGDRRSATLLLAGNPFICDCRLHELLHSPGDGTRYELEQAACATPRDLAGLSLRDAAGRMSCATAI